jgi:hypothetical protein
MKVFISWSGDTSKEVAIAFRDWLPSVIQSVNPYVSSEDINKGVRWSADISAELDSTSFGIICLTQENLDSPWIHFEAGALSKAVDKSRVAPFLLGVKTSEVRGPLLQFQSTSFTKSEVKKLLFSINAAESELHRLDETRLSNCFDVWWEQLDAKLKAIDLGSKPKDEKSHRANAGQRAEIVEEILLLLRAQQKQLSNPAELLPPEYLARIFESTGYPMKHPASRDLGRTLRSVKGMLNELGDECQLSVPEVRLIISDLERPIRYLEGVNMRSMRRPGARAAHSETDQN